MATTIAMPSLGYMMEEGTVATWFIGSGGWAKRGQPVVEITTEKINYEIEASHDGFVHQVASEGQVVAVGNVIGYLLNEDEPPPESLAAESPRGASHTSADASMKQKSSTRTDNTSAIGVISSPAARRVARELGVDIVTVIGSGPNGRIVEDDVKAAALVKPSAGAVGSDIYGTVTQVVPFVGLRGTIARRMVQSVTTSAQYTITLDVDVTDTQRLRRQVGKQLRRQEGIGVRFVDVIALATSRALSKHPDLNAIVVSDEIHWIQEVQLGMAVALDQGVVVPVIRMAHEKNLSDMAKATQDLQDRAFSNHLTPDETTGSTFTISVLGSVDVFTPIINPPEVAVLGVGRVSDKVVVYKGQITSRMIATLSLTLDHRAVDGAPASRFLRTLKRLLESPGVLFSGDNPGENDGSDDES